MFDLLGGHGKVTQILEPRKAFAGSKPTSNFLPCGSRLPLTTKRRPTIALLSKLRRPLNVIHGNDRFTKFNRARGNSVDSSGNVYNANSGDNTVSKITSSSTSGNSSTTCSLPSGSISQFIAVPSRVRSGKTASLSWSTANMASCAVTDNNGNTVSNALSSTSTPVTIQAQTIYTLSCTDTNGNAVTPQSV